MPVDLLYLRQNPRVAGIRERRQFWVGLRDRKGLLLPLCQSLIIF
jgi:hypothetical protein